MSGSEHVDAAISGEDIDIESDDDEDEVGVLGEGVEGPRSHSPNSPSAAKRLVDRVPTDSIDTIVENIRVRQSRGTSLMRNAALAAQEGAGVASTSSSVASVPAPVEEEEQPEPARIDPKIFKQMWQKVRKHIFIFSDASRPIFTRFGDETEFLDFFGMMGLLCELTSKNMEATAKTDAQLRGGGRNIEPGQLDLRHFKAGSRTYVVLKKGHLLFVISSSTGESVASLSAQAEFLYSILLSILTTSMHKIFEKRANFDMRGLLGESAAHMMKGAIRIFNNNPGFGLSSIPVLRVRRSVRESVTKTLKQRLLDADMEPEMMPYAFLLYHLPESKTPYGGVGGSNNVLLITYVSGERAAVHPKDFVLLANFVQSSLPRGARYQEMWAPCCLPEYNSEGYLYLYMTFITPGVSLVFSSCNPEAFSQFRTVKDSLVADWGLTTRGIVASFSSFFGKSTTMRTLWCLSLCLFFYVFYLEKECFTRLW